MSRCKKCQHKTGRRIVTATSKRRGGVEGTPRVHKKACACGCHVEPLAPQEAQ